MPLQALHLFTYQLATQGMHFSSLQSIAKTLRDIGQNALSNRSNKLNAAYSVMRHLTVADVFFKTAPWRRRGLHGGAVQQGDAYLVGRIP